MSLPSGCSPFRMLMAAFFVSESAARYSSRSFFSVAVTLTLVPEEEVLESEDVDEVLEEVPVDVFVLEVFVLEVFVLEVFVPEVLAEDVFEVVVFRFFGASRRDF